MQLIITSHAARRMSERGITEVEIREVLLNYYASVPGIPDGTGYIGNTANGDTLQVCVVNSLIPDKPVKIKTAFWKG